MNEKSKYWSYANIPTNDDVIIEHTLKYSDVDEIKSLIVKFGIDKCKSVWEITMLPDKRMRKLNFFLAKFFFNISFNEDVISEYFNKHKSTRADRINEIFNR